MDSSRPMVTTVAQEVVTNSSMVAVRGTGTVSRRYRPAW